MHTNTEAQITWAAESNFISVALLGAWIILIRLGNNILEIIKNFNARGVEGGGQGGEGRRKEEDQGKRKEEGAFKTL